jgi:hypothetical protein
MRSSFSGRALKFEACEDQTKGKHFSGLPTSLPSHIHSNASNETLILITGRLITRANKIRPSPITRKVLFLRTFFSLFFLVQFLFLSFREENIQNDNFILYFEYNQMNIQRIFFFDMDMISTRMQPGNVY